MAAKSSLLHDMGTKARHIMETEERICQDFGPKDGIPLEEVKEWQMNNPEGNRQKTVEGRRENKKAFLKWAGEF